MTKRMERAAAKAEANRCRVKLPGGRTYLFITPQAHLYTVRFHMHDVRRYGVCNYKAGQANMSCSHLRLKIPHEFRVRDGGHTLEHWRTGLGEGLRFIGNAFRAPF